MVSIGEKAKAIQALQTEMDSLRLESEALSEKQLDVYREFSATMTKLSNQQKALIVNISAIEETMSKILKEN